jgi:hypothetical protein
LAVDCQPLFQRECKGKGLILSTKSFLIYFSDSDLISNLFCEELSRFFKTGGKDTISKIYRKLFLAFLFTFTTQKLCVCKFSSSVFQLALLLRTSIALTAGGKDTSDKIAGKRFTKEKN